jgi:hypothetical protein
VRNREPKAGKDYPKKIGNRGCWDSRFADFAGVYQFFAEWKGCESGDPK